MIDKIKDALQKDGVSLEMFAMQTLQKYTFDTHQSVYYRDIKTNTVREIDVIGDYRSQLYLENIENNVKLIIECKYINTPWVIISSDNLIENTQEGSSIFTTSLNTKMMGNSQVQTIIEKLLFPLPEQNTEYQYNLFNDTTNLGYSVKQVNFKNNVKYKDVPYEAINGLINAVSFTIKEAENSKDNIFVVPIVLIGGNNLYKGYLDKHNDIQVEEIEYGTILARAEPISFEATKIFIVTKEHFIKFIDSKMLAIETLEEFTYQIQQKEK